jgi:hypothetical protein
VQFDGSVEFFLGYAGLLQSQCEQGFLGGDISRLCPRSHLFKPCDGDIKPGLCFCKACLTTNDVIEDGKHRTGPDVVTFLHQKFRNRCSLIARLGCQFQNATGGFQTPQSMHSASGTWSGRNT